jgi:hypothetical protein
VVMMAVFDTNGKWLNSADPVCSISFSIVLQMIDSPIHGEDLADMGSDSFSCALGCQVGGIWGCGSDDE